VIAENQSVVFAKQLNAYTNSVKNKAKTVLKGRKDREINIESFDSLFTKSYIQSSATTENSLSNQKP